MNFIKELVAYLMTHGPALAAIAFAVLSVAEMIVRLTPTTKDDGAVERVGHALRKFFDMVGLPNRAKDGEAHPAIKDKAT